MITNDHLIFAAIAAAAATTYSLRLGGLLLAERLPKTGGFRRFMDALPGTILLSLIVPAAINAGIWGWIATAATALCSLRTGNVFVSMIVGVVIVAISRQFG